jgi:cell shape-determining protein MreC
MAGRNSQFSNASVLFSFLIVGIVLLVLPGRLTSRLSLLFYDTFSPVLQIGRNVQMDALRLHPDMEETVSQKDYERLWKSYKNLRAQLLSLHEDYERLAKIRSGLPSSASGLVPAKIASNTGNYSHELIINKGTNARLRPGQYVLSEHRGSSAWQDDCCLIGQVVETADTTARIRLVTDAMQTLEIIIRRDGTDKNIRAIMVGNGNDVGKVPNMDKELDIRPGDTVYAAVVPGLLDVPIVVGEVVDVKPYEMDPLLWDITVQIAEDLSRLDAVTVIVADETLLKETK